MENGRTGLPLPLLLQLRHGMASILPCRKCRSTIARPPVHRQYCGEVFSRYAAIAYSSGGREQVFADFGTLKTVHTHSGAGNPSNAPSGKRLSRTLQAADGGWAADYAPSAMIDGGFVGMRRNLSAVERCSRAFSNRTFRRQCRNRRNRGRRGLVRYPLFPISV